MDADDRIDQREPPAPPRSRIAAAVALLGKCRRVPGWAAANPRKAAVLGGLGASALALLGVLALLMFGLPRQSHAEVELARAFYLYDSGDRDAARTIAQTLLESRNLPLERFGGPAFLLGAAAAEEAAETLLREDQVRLYLVAARYLEEAAARGFPPERRGEGYYLLGKSLYESGLHAQSIPSLQRALDEDPRRAEELLRLLATAYFYQPNPDPEAALTWIERYLQRPQLPREQRDEAMLDQSRMLLALGRPEESRAALDRIPENSKKRSEIMVMYGRLLLDEADRLAAAAEDRASGGPPADAVEKYQEAIDLLRQAQSRDTLANRATPQSSYLIGVALRRMGDLRAAADQFSRTRRLYLDGPEGLAASLEEAEVLQALYESEQAQAAFVRTVRLAGDPRTLRNPWLSLDELRQRLLRAFRRFEETGKYAVAVELTRSFTPLFDRESALRLRAKTQRAWAESLLEAAADLPDSQAEPIRRQARAQWRAAGRSYATLAGIRVARREYPEDLWNSASAFLAGQDFPSAVRMLREYLKNESRSRRPQALVALGEALLALGRYDEAFQPLSECYQFHPRSPASYRARLIGAQVLMEKDEPEQAKQLLLENLHHESLTPRSIEWRDSLFALGEVLFLEGIRWEAKSRAGAAAAVRADDPRQTIKDLEQSTASLEKAISRLSEAVERYPDAPQVIRAQYSIARAHQEAARLPRRRLEFTSIETTRAALHRQMQEQLSAALRSYGRLQEALNRKQEQAELSDGEKAILRNCYFAQGDILVDLGRYDDAIQAYSSATNRYQHEPEALEALVQMAGCFRRQGRQAEFRGTLEQAKLVLARIRGDAAFDNTTRYSREDWTRYLDWLSTL